MPSKVTLNGQLLYPNDYLAAVEFKGKDVTLTVAGVKIEELRMKGGAKESKPVLTFRETKKKLVLNKTNADTVAAMYGTEAKTWIGKRIALYPTKTQCGRDTVDCIRVREQMPQQPRQQAQQQQQVSDGMSVADELIALLSEREGVFAEQAEAKLETYCDQVLGTSLGNLDQQQAVEVRAAILSGTISVNGGGR